MSNRVHSASFAYPDVDSDTRAVLAGVRRRSLEPDGATFVFETCLRTEVVVAGDRDRLDDALVRVFGDVVEVSEARVRSDADAVEHMFRVAAGLESPIRGEGEVFTQFRQAMADARDSGAISGIFARLIEAAVAVGRQARELMPSSPHDSLAAVAAQVIGGADPVAVLGSGMMASAVVHALHGLPAPPRVTIVARTPDRVRLDPVEIWGFERAVETLETFPAIVSATSAKRRIVDPDEFAGVVVRRTEPLILIDMAMPPDFPIPAAPGVRYLGIDDLARLAGRRGRPDDADPFVHAGAVEAFRAYADHHRLGPVIGGLTRRAEGVVEDAVARFGGRLRDEEDLSLLRQAAHTVARTLIAGPISYVKQPGRAPEEVDVVAESFGVDE